MFFWIFMLAMDLLLPLTMIGFGSYFVKSAGPRKINMVFGYRTAMSMKNKDTWSFAHVFCGKRWRRIGWIMLPLSVGAMLPALGKETGTVGLVGGVVFGVQYIFLIWPVISTEMALKRTFDKQGNRKNKE
ncbi:MAG: SdpI family protein [Clostridiales bacterium]|nr:SdpI family protein [Clostridiales bacterium]